MKDFFCLMAGKSSGGVVCDQGGFPDHGAAVQFRLWWDDYFTAVVYYVVYVFRVSSGKTTPPVTVTFWVFCWNYRVCVGGGLSPCFPVIFGLSNIYNHWKFHILKTLVQNVILSASVDTMSNLAKYCCAIFNKCKYI